MDDELLELQRQFEFAQQAKSSIRLSERNVVELVQKLQDLAIIDFDLLHTVSGKEYITPEQLKTEIAAVIKKSGRVSLIDLADTTGVDLYHVEKQAHYVVSDDPGLMFVQGEIISQAYWDSVAEEINDRLQECSQIPIAELAAQLQVGSELVQSILQPRLGKLVKGRLEGGQLYTPAYVARVTAVVRGAVRAIVVPTNLAAMWTLLQQLVQEMDGVSGVTVDNSFFQSLFNGLLKKGEFLGSLRAGTHWTPTVFAIAQKECIDSFFSQNSFINYEALNKLGISQPLQFLQSRYPEGIPLVHSYAHSSMVEMLDAAIEDAMERSSWIDTITVLPPSLTSQDASKLLLCCPSVQAALKANKAVILGESYVFSSGFVKETYDRIEKEAEVFIHSTSSTATVSDGSEFAKENKVQRDSDNSADSVIAGNESGKQRVASEKGPRKKKGKSTGTKAAIPDTGTDDLDDANPKPKKGQKKGRDASSSQLSGGRKDPAKMQEVNFAAPSEEWVMHKITNLVPDFEQGIGDVDLVLKPLAKHMIPMLVSHLKERRKAIFTENAEKMKQVLDYLQKKLDEPFLNMQLYEKALDLFDDDQPTSATLHRHLLKTMATSMVDMLLHNLHIHTKLMNGIEDVDSEKQESVSLSSAQRTAFAKNLPASLSKKALVLVEALEGKRVEAFMTALRDVAEENGILLKKLDKKLERALLHSYRKDLTSQVSTESDSIALLPKVVSLLYAKVLNRALQAPGRAISAAISRLKDKLDDSALKIVTDYHAATVALLALISASAGDEDDCSSDRILSKREFLESLMPSLKGLVLGNSQS